MDVAKSLAAWQERSPEQWMQSAHRILPPLIMAVLVLAIAYRLAELTWALSPHEPFDRPPPQIVQPSTPEGVRSAANFSALEDSHLFGEAKGAPQAPVEAVATRDAPETTLPLTLMGVTADESGELSQASIMSGRGEQRNYGLGDEIENANGATLQAVYHDCVILSVRGLPEMLCFPDELSAGSLGRPAPAPAPRPEVVVPAEEPSLSNVVTENAESLTDILRMAPAIEGGQVIGFRVNPGRDRETFEALGFMPGDVVTDINGIVLDDPSRALQVFDALGESTQASVTVLRDGVSNVLIVDTTQIQSLMENRQ